MLKNEAKTNFFIDRNYSVDEKGSEKEDPSNAIPSLIPSKNLLGQLPFSDFEWEKFTAQINDGKGVEIFCQENVEAPKGWSQQAVNIVASKYFYGKQGSNERECSVAQLVHRVCRTIADWGEADGYFDNKQFSSNDFYIALARIMTSQEAAFNSPVWFNCGLWHQYRSGENSGLGGYHYNSEKGVAERCQNQYEHPQLSACFIQSVKDDMDGIMDLAKSEALLFKHGSGTGTDLSSLRASREMLSGGGKPSGPMSFLQVYDKIGGVIKSGGKTRRAAKMNTLCDWHGDIEEFIEAKSKEEKKAWALIDAGYDGSFNGDAYQTIAFQNENLSVRASDKFMTAAIHKKDWETKAVTTGETLETKSASDLLDKIAEGTHICGDPGIQFDSAIQKWHTCKSSGRINSTNPCSEYVFLDETACNLASINLLKFKEADERFDLERFKSVVEILITAMDIIVDNASYPTDQIALGSHKFRTIGLGYANLGALIMSYGLPYDSDEARGLAGVITAIMTATAYNQSAKLGSRLGAFDEYEKNEDSMKAVLNLHSDAVDLMPDIPMFSELKREAKIKWHEVKSQTSFRNAQVSVIAPTGTIAFMMDCDTTGIEPDIALVKYKLLAGGGMMKIVNNRVKEALRFLDYDDEKIDAILKHIDEHDTIEGSALDEKHLPIFDCAFKAQNGVRSIEWKAHLMMMSAVQPFISGAISKTVNMPEASSIKDIRDAYIEAWRLGLKCVAIYRDGSKRSQPLNTSKENKSEVKMTRKRLPDTRQSLTHKFEIAGHEGYLTVGLYEDGKPGELFVTMAKEGSTIGGLMDCIGTITSMALQYGVPLKSISKKFSHQRFEPSGFTKNPKIKYASSIIDYVFRWIASEFETSESQSSESESESSSSESSSSFSQSSQSSQSFTAHIDQIQSDSPTCSVCGYLTIRNGACFRCPNCGESLGCS